MELIVGGHGQGQREWLKQTGKDIGRREISGEDCEIQDIFSCGIINDFQSYVRRFSTDLKENLVEQLLIVNPEIIILSDEIGCGIVPMEKKERAWRELHGRLCCQLAGQAECVVRVICGIGSRIK